MAFLAGYHPRGGIEFMEIMGQESEIPQHLDHPTFQERVDYLTEYWTNDVRYAFVSFKLGVAAMDRGAKLEATDMKARRHRLRRGGRGLQALPHDAAVAQGGDERPRRRLHQARRARDDRTTRRSAAGRRGSRSSATAPVKYVDLGARRGAATPGTRVARDKARLPWQLREAIAAFKEALAARRELQRRRASTSPPRTSRPTSSTTRRRCSARSTPDARRHRRRHRADPRHRARRRQGLRQGQGSRSSTPMGSQAAKRAASYNLPRTLELAGKKDEAKRAYQQYAKLYPGGPWAQGRRGRRRQAIAVPARPCS